MNRTRGQREVKPSPELARSREGSKLHPQEADLVIDLVESLPGYLNRDSSRCVVHTEVGVGRSIADVVAAVVQLTASRFPSVLSVRESVVVSALRRFGPTRVDILERLCGLRPGELRGGPLEALRERGVVSLGRGGRVSMGGWYRSGAVIAIEAKLTRWRDALRQAMVYRHFADRVYVALPADCMARPLHARAMFEREGVGLLSVNGGIKTEIRAPLCNTHDWRREFVYSRVARGAGYAVATSP